MTEEQTVPNLPTAALGVSILLFVGIYVWGVIMSLNERAKKSASSSSGVTR